MGIFLGKEMIKNVKNNMVTEGLDMHGSMLAPDFQRIRGLPFGRRHNNYLRPLIVNPILLALKRK